MRARFIAKRDARHVLQPVHALARKRRQQLGERHLALAGDDDVGAGVEIFGDVVSALGSAEHHRPAVQLRGADDAQHVSARHEVGVDADHAAGRRREPLASAASSPNVLSNTSTENPARLRNADR